jgi:hypothetical protein
MTNVLKAASISGRFLLSPFALKVAPALRVEMASKLLALAIKHELATTETEEVELILTEIRGFSSTQSIKTNQSLLIMSFARGVKKCIGKPHHHNGALHYPLRFSCVLPYQRHPEYLGDIPRGIFAGFYDILQKLE